MKRNMGTIDRALRLIAGVALIGSALVGAIDVWGYVGVIPLLTAVFGYCPVYVLFGFQTCPLETEDTSQGNPPANA
ncbi:MULTISPECIES: DUF2892 domain-containing protein [unclassified Haematospirillum]|uniref:YgaP family membrane protein n=1 Tax=unclassified Haematospirillum TaxID=2622088 RepID=UPI00143BC646|nr:MULTISPECIES: DUF2892 domain-containing protein [unclassified Haematospirillum]NKD55310.1 DUF2892 domain-containing protein [Haematospirillum sp. H4890]NKD75529.1 DUF2892 domain-containing protein [Haematospirillum sp. H4485]NKD88387.1 DUF2892 domain-containing protein [Haematospirillum sp. 15-248]